MKNTPFSFDYGRCCSMVFRHRKIPIMAESPDILKNSCSFLITVVAVSHSWHSAIIKGLHVHFCNHVGY